MLADPNESGTVYAATDWGLFKSSDAGRRWELVGDDLPGLSGVEYIWGRHPASHPLAIDAETGVMYIGTSDGSGVFASNDGGHQWSVVGGGFPAAPVRTLTVEVGDGATMLYAGTNAGLFRKDVTDDAPWRVVSGLPADLSVTAVVGAPLTGAIYVGTTTGLFRCIDDGVCDGIEISGSSLFHVPTLVIDPGNPEVLYAAAIGYERYEGESVNDTPASPGLSGPRITFWGVYRSNDEGDTWTGGHEGMANDLPFYRQIQALAVDPAQPGALYAATFRWGLFRDWSPAVFKSSDGGDTWTEMQDGLGERFVSAFATVAGAPEPLVAATFFSTGIADYGIRVGTGIFVSDGRDTESWSDPGFAGPCPGDCNEDGRIAVSELVTGIGMALGRNSEASCPAFDLDADQEISVAELVAAVDRARCGCQPVDFVTELLQGVD